MILHSEKFKLIYILKTLQPCSQLIICGSPNNKKASNKNFINFPDQNPIYKSCIFGKQERLFFAVLNMERMVVINILPEKNVFPRRNLKSLNQSKVVNTNKCIILFHMPFYAKVVFCMNYGCFI